MWKLTSTDIPSSHALRVLRQANVHYVSDILDWAGVDIRKFSESRAADVVSQFCTNCEDLVGFGSQSRKRLSAFLDSQKSQILDHYFLEITKLRTLPSNDEESDEDFIPDLGSILPTETLLINVSVIKGSVEFACIEDVITEMEEEIAETDDTFTEEQIHEIVMDAFLIDQWPADRPIYISEQAAVVYPEIVVNLTKIALLVLK